MGRVQRVFILSFLAHQQTSKLFLSRVLSSLGGHRLERGAAANEENAPALIEGLNDFEWKAHDGSDTERASETAL